MGTNFAEFLAVVGGGVLSNGLRIAYEFVALLFKKKNLYDTSIWWLSTFYTFCIQVMVRKALFKTSWVSLNTLEG
jgi:hypothetical protein